MRFIDLLKLVKPLNWSHMMVLRPKPSGGHRTIGLTVAPLRVLSRLRKPLAQQWENEHDAPYFWGCQGKACDRAAWAHSIMVAAAKGWQQSAASLLLDLAKFYEHVGHDHLWEEGRKTRFPTRLLACWCASYEGWRFLEADKCATFPFWAFGTILPGCSGATTAAKLMLATLLETVATRLPTYRLWNVVDDISGHVAGTPKMVQVLTAEAGRLLVEGLKARDLPLSKRQVQSPHRWSGQAQACPIAAAGGARDRRERYGTQRGGLLAAGQAAAGAGCQGPVGESYEENEASQAAPQGRGTHWQAHSHWL